MELPGIGKVLRPEKLAGIFTELRKAEDEGFPQTHVTKWPDAENIPDHGQMNDDIECRQQEGGHVATQALAESRCLVATHEMLEEDHEHRDSQRNLFTQRRQEKHYRAHPRSDPRKASSAGGLGVDQKRRQEE